MTTNHTITIDLPNSEETLSVYNNRDLSGDEGDGIPPWTVQGDLRSYATQYDITNHDIADGVRAEIGNLDVMFDAEISCFFAYCQNQAEAMVVANLAVAVATKLHGFDFDARKGISHAEAQELHEAIGVALVTAAERDRPILRRALELAAIVVSDTDPKADR